MPIRSFHFSSNGVREPDPNPAELPAIVRTGEGLLWIDIQLPDSVDARLLRDLGMHRLVVESCLGSDPRSPKVDDYGSHLYIVVHGINYLADSDLVETAELDMILGNNFVVTVHHDRLFSVEETVAEVNEDPELIPSSAAMFGHSILQRTLDNVRPTVEAMSDVADAVEEQALQNPSRETLEAIQKLKRSTLRLRRFLTPEIDSLGRLARFTHGPIDANAGRFFEDLSDRAARIAESNNILRERADSALSTYLSTVGIQQNQAMKTLAAIAAIFFPLSLIAGIYGMNFENMPELDWEYGYFAVLGVMGTVMLGILWGFWIRQHVKARNVARIPVAPFAAAAHRVRMRATRRGE
ncbi:MAG: magnesium transporter CorA family protein [Chloroflexi bacterium]|nr:magnesium transporter CorA family protein [Chloroflexota bacterium]